MGVYFRTEKKWLAVGIVLVVVLLAVLIINNVKDRMVILRTFDITADTPEAEISRYKEQLANEQNALAVHDIRSEMVNMDYGYGLKVKSDDVDDAKWILLHLYEQTQMEEWLSAFDTVDDADVSLSFENGKASANIALTVNSKMDDEEKEKLVTFVTKSAAIVDQSGTALYPQNSR